MNLSTKYSFYIKLIKATIYDVTIFTSILIVLFMMLANALMILNEGRYQDVKFVQQIFSLKPFDALMNQYMLALGEYDFENFGLNQNDKSVWFIFLMATCGTQIVLLNMLIAIMGDTFNQVSDTKKQGMLKEKLAIMADYAGAVPRLSKEELQKIRFVYAIKTLLGDNNDWEGTVTQMKKFMNLTNKKI